MDRPAAPPLHHLYEAIRRRNIPLSVVVELTRKCNLTCVHCYATPEAGRRELTLEEYRAFLDDLHAMGTLFVLFTGGDVTVNPHFLDIVEHASERHLASQIFTNAVLFDDAQIARLARLTVMHVSISVYGATAETHDAITGHAGSFERTMRNAAKLQDAGIYTHLKFVMMQGNTHEYEDMKALADRLGLIYRIDVSIAPRHNRDQEVLRLRISDEDLRRIFFDQINCFPGAKPCSTPEMEFGCGMGKTFCAVNAYGDLYPCIQMPVPVGNIRRRRFSELWSGSSQLEFFRRYPADRELPVCTSCSIKQYCYRCPGQAFQETGDMYAPYEEACRHAQAWKDVVEGPARPANGGRRCEDPNEEGALFRVGMTMPV